MENLFRTILNMSVTGSYVIMAVLLMRLLLRRAPKKYSYLLWSVVGFRLACPLSFRSAFSLFNLGLFSAQSSGRALSYVPVYMGAGTDYDLLLNDMKAPEPISTGIAALDPAVQEMVPISMKYSLDWFTVLSWVWCVGVALMLVYAVVSYVRLRRSLAKAVHGEGNVWYAENLRSPFILGFVKPRIYLPFGLDEAAEGYVLSHERCHLRRGDHWVKPLGFLLLSLHWFNPLCHLAFYLMGLDMEMSCDERVLRAHEGISKPYSTTLLSFAANRRFPVPSPLAFAESGAGKRIRNVLRWKRPRLWLSILAALVCLAVVVGCAANPKAEVSLDVEGLTRAVITLKPTGDGNEPTVTIGEGNTLLRELEKLLQAVELGGKGENYGGQTVGFDLTLADGGTMNVIVSDPGIAIDGVTYTADEAGCAALTAWAEEFFQPLPEKGTPPEDEDDTLGKPYELGLWAPPQDYVYAVAGVYSAPVSEYWTRVYAENNPLITAVSQALIYNDAALAADEYHAVSFMILDHVEAVGVPKQGSDEECKHRVDVLAAVMHQNFRFTAVDGLELLGGKCSTMVLCFEVDEEGEYILIESREGTDERFDDEVNVAWWEDEALYLALRQDCYAQAVRQGGVDTAGVVDALFARVSASPATSSHPGDYIKAHEEEVQELLCYGNYTLKRIYERFLAGGETGLEGHLMQYVMEQLLGDQNLTRPERTGTGQAYFDELLAQARAMEAEEGEYELVSSAPKLWLLLRMAEEG